MHDLEKYSSPEKEDQNNFLEKESLNLENFEIYCNNKTSNILEKDVEKDFNEVKEFVDNVLGSEWKMGDKKVKVYLFSDEKRYFDYLDKNFPHLPKDFAVFDKETNSIINYTPISEKDYEQYKEELQKAGISSRQELEDLSRANILSSVAHELGHMHPFFGGVGNEGSKNKWEQEMVCDLIGERMRTKFGNERLRNSQLKEAQDYLEELHQEGKRFSWTEKGEDWDNFTMPEKFVYSWLEKKYGLEKLRDLWYQLFKEKKTLPKSISNVYGREINDLENEFEKDILEAKSYRNIEISRY